MIRRLSYYFLILAAGLFINMSHASPEPRDHGMHYKKDGVSEYKKGHDWWLNKLDLTEEQRQQIKAISDEIKPQLKEKKAELRDISMQIRGLATSDNYDEGQVNELADRKGDIVADLTRLKASKKARVHALLTPEQKEKLADLKQKKKDKRKNKTRQ